MGETGKWKFLDFVCKAATPSFMAAFQKNQGPIANWKVAIIH